MTIQRIEEFRIDPPTGAAIRELLARCFPDYPAGQTYFKQLPDFRLLGWENDRLAGHLAVEHRLVNNGGVAVRIFGIADLCVEPALRHRQIATHLLEELENLGRANGIDFILLLAKEHQLYLRNGFQVVENPCRWLLIHQQQTMGVVQRTIAQTLMVKGLGAKSWRTGLVDFLGHIF